MHVTWGPERDPSARLRWCAAGPFCPTRLITLLAGPAIGSTAILSKPANPSYPMVTLTVVGGGARERGFAESVLIPTLMECVRVLATAVGGLGAVRVTYCNACPARELPARRGTIITSEHVNGGICTGPRDGVLVFRRQDAAKVLIHELLHLFGVDAPLQGLSPRVEARIARPSPGLWGEVIGSVPLHLSEAYTDTLACLVFCGDPDRAKTCAMERACRVLRHFDMGRKPFLEATHVFSYYIVKAAMLLHAEAFVGIIHGFTSPLVPRASVEVTRVVEFMGACVRSSTFRDAITRGCLRLTPSGNSLSMTDGLLGRIRFCEVGVLI